MDFKQIEAFANVVKYKSFSKAADALFLTQPTISTHISSLEKELGLLLIDRSSKQIKPTAEGKLFYKYAVSMLNTRAKALYFLQNLPENLEGVVEIQTSTVPGQYFLPKAMKGFSGIFPGSRFYVEQSDSSQVIENLLDQKGEIGFTGSKGTPGLVYEPIFHDEVVLLVPAEGSSLSNHPRPSVSIKDFIKLPFLWREEGSATRRDFEDSLMAAGHGLRELNITARMNNMEAIREGVAAGLGVSMASKLSVETGPADPRIKAFSIEGFKGQRSFYMAYRKNSQLSPIGEAFKSFILEKYVK